MNQNYPKVPLRLDYSKQGQLSRLGYLEKLNSISLEQLSNSRLQGHQVKGNIESFLGSIEIPVGLAGPLLMGRPDQQKDWVFAPIATSEGALVASMTRGAFAVGLSGGVTVKALKQRMTRAPLFIFENLSQSESFISWIERNYQRIKTETKRYSNHAKLVEIKPECFGKTVHLKFFYETADASGQNMTTTCTWQAILWIEKTFNSESEFVIKDYVLEANGSSDKKVSAGSLIHTRGTRVIAECELTESAIRRVLKTTSQKLIDLYTRAFPMASLDGMVGYSVNAANAVAGFFASTGQDLACIHESSVCVVHMEKTEKGLYCSILFPSLVVGTVGGGTGLPGPQEVLEIMDCKGSGKSQRLAEIIASYALALELSTMAAITSGDFALAHERLGRNHPIDFLKISELNKDFFNQNFYFDHKITQLSELEPIDSSNAVAMDLAQKVSEKVLGFFPYQVKFENGDQQSVLIKSKPKDSELALSMEIIAGMVDERLKLYFSENQKFSPYRQGHQTEGLVYQILNQEFSQFIPKFFGSYSQPSREIFLIAQELLTPEKMKVLNAENNPEVFDNTVTTSIVQAIGQIHGHFHKSLKQGRSLSIPCHRPWEHAELSQKILEYGLKDQLSPEEITAHAYQINRLANSGQVFEQLPKTLTHSDFTPRNIAIREDGTPCFYDWEMAKISYPQNDLMEFLIFSQIETLTAAQLFEFIESHRRAFCLSSGTEHTLEKWLAGCTLAVSEIVATSLSYLMIGNRFREYAYLSWAYPNAFKMFDHLQRGFQ